MLMPIELPLPDAYDVGSDIPTPDRKEKRVFECPKCNFMNTVTVPDPLESRSTGWLLGELRPPKARRGNAVTHEVREGRMIPKSTE
jgi:hypothetical protein